MVNALFWIGYNKKFYNHVTKSKHREVTDLMKHKIYNIEIYPTEDDGGSLIVARTAFRKKGQIMSMNELH